ncbi:hypothetical protein HDU84_007847 [Entophlyctis sp. JEL0112]|nr:hypothetical protein HDU84_007847 [Entophlyctis sp. JEL0112]
MASHQTGARPTKRARTPADADDHADSDGANLQSHRLQLFHELPPAAPSSGYHHSHSSPEPSDGQAAPKKPGRKRTEIPADDRRTAQNRCAIMFFDKSGKLRKALAAQSISLCNNQRCRLAQRAFRDRKLQHVRDLETKVKQLTAIIEGNSEFSKELDCVVSSFNFIPGVFSSPPLKYLRRIFEIRSQNLNQNYWRIMFVLRFGSAQIRATYRSQQPAAGKLYSTPASPNFQENASGAPLLPPIFSTTSLPLTLSPSASANNLVDLLFFDNGILQEMNYSPPSSIITSDDVCDPNKEREFTPSCEQFGEINLNIDQIREKLKSFSRLENESTVDDFIELIMTLSKCSTKHSLKRLIIRFSALKHKLLDTCSLIEKHRFLELTENFKTEIKSHMDFFYAKLRTSSVAQGRTPLSEYQAQVLEQLQQFKNMTKAIPSFKDAGDLVDDLCFEFSSQALCKDEAEREEKYVQVMAIQGQLQMLCKTEEDRTKSQSKSLGLVFESLL